MATPYKELIKTPYQLRGTYKESTGTYVSSSGQGFSVAPEKAKWIVVNTGGGGRGANIVQESPKVVETPDVTNPPNSVQETMQQPVTTTTATSSSRPNAVVYGFPQFSNQQAQDLVAYAKSTGTRPEFSYRTEKSTSDKWFEGGVPTSGTTTFLDVGRGRREGKTIVLGTESVPYLEERNVLAEKLNKQGWTASELLAGEKFIPAPKTLSFDTSKFYPSEAVLKGGRTELKNPYNISGESLSGGIGGRTEKLNLGKYASVAALGIFSNKEIREGTFNAMENIIISPARGGAKLTRIGINPSTLATKNEYVEGGYSFNRQKLLGDVDIQRFGAYTLLSPLSQVPVARYIFAYGGIKAGVETFKEKPTLAGGTEASIYATLGILSIPKYNIATRTFMKLSPEYKPLSKTGIEYVEGTTIPTTLSELQKLETKRIQTIHVTTADLPKEFVITAQTQGAKSVRIENLILGLFRSSPINFRETMVKGYTTKPVFKTILKDFPLLFQQAKTTGVPSKVVYPFIRYTSKPTAYLGYGGITGETADLSSGKLIFGNKPIKLFMETLTLSESPVGGTLRETSILQMQNPATYIAPQDVFRGGKLKIEGQVYTPPAYYANTGELVIGTPKAGEVIIGSKTTRLSGEKFTFYPERKANVITSAVEKIMSKPLSREGFVFKTLSTTRFFKLELQPVKTTSISGTGVVIKNPLEGNPYGKDIFILTEGQGLKAGKLTPVLDIAEYSKLQNEYYEGTRVISPSNVFSSQSFFSGVSPSVESPSLVSSISASPSRSSGYFLTTSIPRFGFDSSIVSSGDNSSGGVPSVPPSVPPSKGGSSGGYSFPSISIPSIPPSVPPSIPPSRGGSGVFSFISSPSRRGEFNYPIASSVNKLFSFGKQDFFKESKKRKEKKVKMKVSDLGVYVLPDLRSVSMTEAETYRRFGGGEAIAPKLTKDIYRSALISFKGYGTGYIPSEQMRTGKVRL